MKIPDKFLSGIKENPYVLAVLALGLVLMLLPAGEKTEAAPVKAENDSLCPAFSLEKEQERLQSALESISGVGKTKVLLSLKSTAERRLALSDGETVILSAGSGREQPVELNYIYPEYMGAVIVCQGAESAQISLQVISAVSAFTGLGTDSIQVLKME